MHAIGISLGTTASCIAVYDTHQAVVLPNRHQDRTTPSVIAYTHDNILIGKNALRCAHAPLPRNKKVAGATQPATTQVLNALPHLTDTLEEDEATTPQGLKSPEDRCADLLSFLAKSAQDHLKHPIDHVVVSVPPQFSQQHRRMVRAAAKRAGLPAIHILDETIAAALAHTHFTPEHSDVARTIAVCTLGGQRFSCALLRQDGPYFETQFLETDTELGGQAFDAVLTAHLLDDIRTKTGHDLQHESLALERLRDAARTLKHTLSHAPDATEHLPFLFADPATQTPFHYTATLTRETAEDLFRPLIPHLLSLTRMAFSRHALDPAQVDDLILVGGMAQVPAITTAFADLFDHPPKADFLPDEVAALGAAVQANLLRNNGPDLSQHKVAALSIGLETKSGIFTPLIARGTPLPAQATASFSTSFDNQEGVQIAVYQGQRSMAKHNTLLGAFAFVDMASAPRGLVPIAITLQLETTGALHLLIRNAATGQQRGLALPAQNDLSFGEITRAVAQAITCRTSDRQALEHAQSRNKALDLLYFAQQTTDLPEAAKHAAAQLHEYIDTSQTSHLKDLTAALQKAFSAPTGEARA